jgi:hypothetical protein
MKRFFLLSILVAGLSACTAPEDEPHVDPTKPVEKKDPELGDVNQVETLFDEDRFENEVHAELIRELDYAYETEDPACPRCALVSPRFFKVFNVKPGSDVKDLFAIQIKALTILKGAEKATPDRNLVVFARENGQLVKTNGFRGNLIRRITNSSGVDDLIIRFHVYDREYKSDIFYNCLFKWEEGRYYFSSVEEIYGSGANGKVKESMKAEISADVKVELTNAGMIY